MIQIISLFLSAGLMATSMSAIGIGHPHVHPPEYWVNLTGRLSSGETKLLDEDFADAMVALISGKPVKGAVLVERDWLVIAQTMAQNHWYGSWKLWAKVLPRSQEIDQIGSKSFKDVGAYFLLLRLEQLKNQSLQPHLFYKTIEAIEKVAVIELVNWQLKTGPKDYPTSVCSLFLHYPTYGMRGFADIVPELHQSAVNSARRKGRLRGVKASIVGGLCGVFTGPAGWIGIAGGAAIGAFLGYLSGAEAVELWQDQQRLLKTAEILREAARSL